GLPARFSARMRSLKEACSSGQLLSARAGNTSQLHDPSIPIPGPPRPLSQVGTRSYDPVHRKRISCRIRIPRQHTDNKHSATRFESRLPSHLQYDQPAKGFLAATRRPDPTRSIVRPELGPRDKAGSLPFRPSTSTFFDL